MDEMVKQEKYIKMQKGKEMKKKFEVEIKNFVSNDNDRERLKLMLGKNDVWGLTILYKDIKKKINEGNNNSNSEFKINEDVCITVDNAYVASYISILLSWSKIFAPNIDVSSASLISSIQNKLLTGISDIEMQNIADYEIESEYPILNKNIDNFKSEWDDCPEQWFPNGKIRCGCITNCVKCNGGFMDKKLITINRCTACTPYLEANTLGFTCKCQVHCRVFNSSKKCDANTTKNPPIGLCKFCMIRLLHFNIQLKFNESLIEMVTIIYMIMVRSTITTDLNQWNEYDYCMGHCVRHNKYRLGIIADERAKKRWPKSQSISLFLDTIEPNSNKTYIRKLLYFVNEDVKMNDESNDNISDSGIEFTPKMLFKKHLINEQKKEQKQENDMDEDNEQWIDPDDRECIIKGESKKSFNIISHHYNYGFAERVWLLDSEVIGLGVYGWSQYKFIRQMREFIEFNLRNLKGCIKDGEYDPGLDIEYLNHAYPCVNFNLPDNQDLKQKLLEEQPFEEFHVITLINKQFVDGRMLFILIDPNEVSQDNKVFIVNKLFKNMVGKEHIEIQYYDINVNKDEYLQAFEKLTNIKISMKKGACDQLSNIFISMNYQDIISNQNKYEYEEYKTFIRTKILNFKKMLREFKEKVNRLIL